MAKMGEETDSGHWSNPYEVQFPFITNDGSHFFFGHDTDSKYWFIQQLLDGGKMGSETANGHWRNAYEDMFAYSIKGRTFCFSHSRQTRQWFIQELLPGGQLGSETDSGSWSNAYGSTVPFWINSRLFFVRQRKNSPGRTWFVQELLPDGRMGDLTGQADADELADVAFTFEIAARTYLLTHNVSSRHMSVTELLAGGKVGVKVYRDFWQSPYVMFTYRMLGDDYYYGQNLDNNNWFIQELLTGGTPGEQTDSGHWKFTYQVQFPFEIGGRQFFYGCSLNTTASPFHPYHWFIQELLGINVVRGEESTSEEWAKVSIWSYRGLPQGVGHAALTLSDGTYISWWPTRSTGGKFDSEEMQHLSDAFSSPATKNTPADDLEAEGYSADVEIFIPGGSKGLDISRISSWWDGFRDDPRNKYSVLNQNCAKTVKDALAAGGAWKFLTGRVGDDFDKIITWTPWELQDLVGRLRERIVSFV